MIIWIIKFPFLVPKYIYILFLRIIKFLIYLFTMPFLLFTRGSYHLVNRIQNIILNFFILIKFLSISIWYIYTTSKFLVPNIIKNKRRLTFLIVKIIIYIFIVFIVFTLSCFIFFIFVDFFSNLFLFWERYTTLENSNYFLFLLHNAFIWYITEVLEIHTPILTEEIMENMIERVFFKLIDQQNFNLREFLIYIISEDIAYKIDFIKWELVNYIKSDLVDLIKDTIRQEIDNQILSMYTDIIIPF